MAPSPAPAPGLDGSRDPPPPPTLQLNVSPPLLCFLCVNQLGPTQNGWRVQDSFTSAVTKKVDAFRYGQPCPNSQPDAPCCPKWISFWVSVQSRPRLG